jgi:hypothetical protein
MFLKIFSQKKISEKTPNTANLCKKWIITFEKNANVFAEKLAKKPPKTVITTLAPVYCMSPGVDVMITIFCDFSQFSAKKLAFFLITNVAINFFQNLALFRVKNANFIAKFFGENIFKIIT